MEFGSTITCLDGVCAPAARVTVVVIGLLLFGVAYNAGVAWLEKKGHDRGYTAFLVVGGVAVTLLGAAVLVGVGVVLWLFVCFAASGLAMVVGSWARNSQERKQDEERALELAREMLADDETKNDGVRNAAGDHQGGEREPGSTANGGQDDR